MSTRAPKPTISFVDLAHRTAVAGLLGLGLWGFWITAAVWKSRRGGEMITTPNGAGSSPQSPQEDPFPITNDPVHEPGRNV